MTKFHAGMICCKAEREAQGLACPVSWMRICAWHSLARLRRDRSDALPRAAARLVEVLPMVDVWWAFDAAGESSTLAMHYATRAAGMTAASARSELRAEIVGATSPEFVATFDVLLQAALERQ